METLIRLARVPIVLLIGLFVISFVIGIGSPETGAVEKLALVALLVGCVLAAVQITKWASTLQKRARH
jgi:hypothetical protein